MTLKTIIITILIGVGVMMGCSVFYSDMASTYTSYTPSLVNTTDDFSAFTNATTDLTKIFEKLQDDIIDPGEGSPKISDIQDAAALFIGFGKIIIEIPDVLSSLLTGTRNMIGAEFLPQWFITMMTTIIIVVFVFAVVAFLWKRGEI